MKILGIETSCDETAISVVEAKGGKTKPQFKILSNTIASQIKIHRPFGGVVPNLAKREHIKNLPVVLEQSLKEAETKKEEIDLIAVTVGPGLEPALWTGINFAEELGKKWDTPVAGANHMEAHLYSTLIKGSDVPLPSVALIVSGGHTILLVLKTLDNWQKIGETRDDAVGEAFDKVARMLELPYPGGPEIQKLSEQGNPEAIPFPRPMINSKDYDFSFSGLKTAIFYYLRDTKGVNKADVAASFQDAAVEVLVSKTLKAAEEHKAKSVLLAGGVAANTYLREKLEKSADKSKLLFFVPEFKYNTDNAAMIAVSAYINKIFKKKPLPLEANSNLSL